MDYKEKFLKKAFWYMKSDTIYLFLRVDGNNFPSGIHQAMYFDYEVKKTLQRMRLMKNGTAIIRKVPKKLATSFDT